MLWSCFIHVLVTFQTCVGHASHMFWPCFKHVLVMFQSEDSQSVSLSDSQSVSLRVCRAVSLLIYQFVRQSVCQFVSLSICQVVSLSGRRSYIHSYSTRKFQNRYVFSIVLIAFWSATGVSEKDKRNVKKWLTTPRTPKFNVGSDKFLERKEMQKNTTFVKRNRPPKPQH